jgi:ATP-dependent Clp protease ATP-binding subunit ClpA
MFETLSIRARQAVFAARFKAGQRGADNIEVGDLILGLILEDQGGMEALLAAMHDGQAAASVLDRPIHTPFLLPETANKLVAEIEALLPRAATVPHTRELPLSPELQRIFEGAKEVQRVFGQDQIGPLHLISAILADEPSRYTKLLEHSGVTTETVSNRLRAMKLGEQGQTRQWSHDLAKAINEAIAKSESIATIASEARRAGFRITLHLEAIMSVKRSFPEEKTSPGRLILESLQLRLDSDENLES